VRLLVGALESRRLTNDTRFKFRVTSGTLAWGTLAHSPSPGRRESASRVRPLRADAKGRIALLGARYWNFPALAQRTCLAIRDLAQCASRLSACECVRKRVSLQRESPVGVCAHTLTAVSL